ncbi:unnamed protein product [Lasius platythorax]|uniref:Uncharacterized protein n=1 Tax=Lasius platythorax TaxID=488582 RepID=A0AAV2MWX1_9HYME
MVGWHNNCLISSRMSRMTPTCSQLLLSLADDEPDKEEITLCNMELSLTNLKKNVLVLKTFYNINYTIWSGKLACI